MRGGKGGVGLQASARGVRGLDGSGDHLRLPATFDVRQADYAIDYIKQHAKDDKPWFCRQFAFSRVYESVNH
jgi:hypothetical protein